MAPSLRQMHCKTLSNERPSGKKGDAIMNANPFLIILTAILFLAIIFDNWRNMKRIERLEHAVNAINRDLTNHIRGR